MLWTLVTLVSRALTLRRLEQNSTVQKYLAPALAWYKARPLKVRLAVDAGVALVLLGILFG